MSKLETLAMQLAQQAENYAREARKAAQSFDQESRIIFDRSSRYFAILAHSAYHDMQRGKDSDESVASLRALSSSE
jgi:hypothetical protein